MEEGKRFGMKHRERRIKEQAETGFQCLECQATMLIVSRKPTNILKVKET